MDLCSMFKAMFLFYNLFCELRWKQWPRSHLRETEFRSSHLLLYPKVLNTLFCLHPPSNQHKGTFYYFLKKHSLGIFEILNNIMIIIKGLWDIWQSSLTHKKILIERKCWVFKCKFGVYLRLIKSGKRRGIKYCSMFPFTHF